MHHWNAEDTRRPYLSVKTQKICIGKYFFTNDEALRLVNDILEMLPPTTAASVTPSADPQEK